jgi:hypothetical protein
MNEDQLLRLLYKVSKAYFERTGESLWRLSPTQQRKEIENYMEDNQ